MGKATGPAILLTVLLLVFSACGNKASVSSSALLPETFLEYQTIWAELLEEYGLRERGIYVEFHTPIYFEANGEPSPYDLPRDEFEALMRQNIEEMLEDIGGFYE